MINVAGILTIVCWSDYSDIEIKRCDLHNK